MMVNADCTIYEKNSFTRHPVSGVYWNDSRGAAASKNGIQISDSIILYLYDMDYLPKAGDLVVRGLVDFVFDTSTQRAASESMQAFREACPDFAVIKQVQDCRFGGLPHIEAIAR